MKIKKNDLFIGIYLLAAVLFFIISIPSWLLDILLAINILVAMVVLFNSLFAKEVLDMASFPTMLLFTTIFRISLNVSSTKLILKNGDAGKVIDTFGKFVGGGNLVIGIIIFIILIIVQFIVINKGSERVAEVTARFTLDAMAGKQMLLTQTLIQEPLLIKRLLREERSYSRRTASLVLWMVLPNMLREMQLQVLLLPELTLLVVLSWEWYMEDYQLMMLFLSILFLQSVTD